jgi:hypothetical protein
LRTSANLVSTGNWNLDIQIAVARSIISSDSLLIRC